MNNWLVSVEKNGKVVELYYSKNLNDFGAIRAIHPGCNVVASRMNNMQQEDKGVKEQIEPTKSTTRRVRCLDTGEIFNSVTDCAESLNVSRWNVYKAIHRGTVLCKKHYDYV